MRADFPERAVVLVHEDEIGHGVVGHDEIHPAVAVNVHRRDAEGLGGGHAGRGIFHLQTALRRDVGEMAVAVVVIKMGKRALEIHGLAVGARPAVNFVADLGVNFARPLDVVADEEVELAVVVVIKKRRARAPVVGRTAHARLLRHFVEFAVAVVVEQMIAADRRDEHIGQPVVVVIPDGHAHAVKTHVQARAGRHIREMAVAVIVIERHG